MPHDLYLAGALFAPLVLAVLIGWTVHSRRATVREADERASSEAGTPGAETTPPGPDRPGSAEETTPEPEDPLPETPGLDAQVVGEPARLQELANAIADGNRRALSRGITLVESRSPDDRQPAADLVQALYPKSGDSIRIGISGPPGVGKSTFSEIFGLYAIAQGSRVAVLAVDPSSTISGGSILGDKTRMEELGRSDSAFIRPSPSGGVHGGIARGVRESITLCEAAGFNVILIETMGVGQAELAVRDVVDLVALLVQPGAGDSLQGIKRGIIEIADFILVNKADGDLKQAAALTVGEYKRALRLMSPPSEAWRPEVLACSAIDGTGIDQVWERTAAFADAAIEAGTWDPLRSLQATSAVWNYLNLAIRESIQDIRANPEADVERWEEEVRSGQTAPAKAATALIDLVYDGSIVTRLPG